MQAVMISIQPKWCELIASGKKTVEIRKTAPKLQPPFTCYIYCTTNGSTIRTAPKPYCKNVDGSTIFRQHIMNGHVIGEFVCDEVAYLNIDSIGVSDGAGYYLDERGWKPCLSREEVIKYCGILRPYGWHISQLYVYDKPKKLNDFKRWNRTEDNLPCAHTKALYEPCETCKECNLTRPFQSWGYVEELHDAD